MRRDGDRQQREEIPSRDGNIAIDEVIVEIMIAAGATEAHANTLLHDNEKLRIIVM